MSPDSMLLAPAGAIVANGQVTIGVSTVRLPDHPSRAILVVPHPDNTGDIFIGHVGVQINTGVYLPSTGLSLGLHNVADIYAISTIADQTITYLAVK